MVVWIIVRRRVVPERQTNNPPFRIVGRPKAREIFVRIRQVRSREHFDRTALRVAFEMIELVFQ